MITKKTAAKGRTSAAVKGVGAKSGLSLTKKKLSAKTLAAKGAAPKDLRLPESFFGVLAEVAIADTEVRGTYGKKLDRLTIFCKKNAELVTNSIRILRSPAVMSAFKEAGIDVDSILAATTATNGVSLAADQH